MANSMRCVGLDVHVRETQAAVLDEGTGELSYRRIRGRPHEVVPYLEGLERPFRAVYEAGPTGYGLARRARERGLDVGVCAPGHVLRRRQDRIKTDRRDAERLARLLWAGELRLVLVPEPWQEELRDVVRCREDLRVDLMRARHRISKLCLRRERYFHGPGRAWTRRHRDWLSGLRFPDRATQLTLSDYMHAHDVLVARRERLEAELFELALASPFASTVRNLRCLRGIDTAVGGRALLRGARLPPLPGQAARELPGARALGGLDRRGAAAGLDHQGRLKARPPAAGRGGLALPPPPYVSDKLARRQEGCDPRAVESPGEPSAAYTAAGGA
jgi:transposase